MITVSYDWVGAGGGLCSQPCLSLTTLGEGTPQATGSLCLVWLPGDPSAKSSVILRKLRRRERSQFSHPVTCARAQSRCPRVCTRMCD